MPTPTIERGLANYHLCQNLNMDIIGGRQNALEDEGNKLEPCNI